MLSPVRGICHVCRELKVVTGEWFLEERSKSFEQGAPSCDVIKQTILNSSPSEFYQFMKTKQCVMCVYMLILLLDCF